MANTGNRIRFETKAQGNERRRSEFLALTPHERFLVFLKGFSRSNGRTAVTRTDKGNFIIENRRNGVRG
ncbi:MAG TPA: hypothetical protein PLR96_02540 [Flavobacteriales bacterium]|nr:hypothetical protein [Flavobacteriales bacterium]